MYTILLDSSNTDLSIGLAKDDLLIDYVSYSAWQEQSEHMIPELDKILENNHVNKEDIEDVIVGIGPGSYTGVRIAITIAKVLGTALNIPVYPVSSLEILKAGRGKSVCLINARSSRSYIGVYDENGEILKDQILTNDEVKTYLENNPGYIVCGDTQYIGIDGVKVNVLETMINAKKHLSPIDNVLALKPVYLKD